MANQLDCLKHHDDSVSIYYAVMYFNWNKWSCLHKGDLNSRRTCLRPLHNLSDVTWKPRIYFSHLISHNLGAFLSNSNRRRHLTKQLTNLSVFNAAPKRNIKRLVATFPRKRFLCLFLGNNISGSDWISQPKGDCTEFSQLHREEHQTEAELEPPSHAHNL